MLFAAGTCGKSVVSQPCSCMRPIKSLLFLVSFFVLWVINAGAQITTIPVVTLQSSDPYASWSGDTGTFTVVRDGPTNETLNIYYLIGGSASNGVDYATIGNWIMIPAGT